MSNWDGLKFRVILVPLELTYKNLGLDLLEFGSSISGKKDEAKALLTEFKISIPVMLLPDN